MDTLYTYYDDAIDILLSRELAERVENKKGCSFAKLLLKFFGGTLK